MRRCVLLTAWHRGYLCLDPRSGRIASARAGSAFLRYPPILAHFPEPGGDIALLAPLTEPDATIAIAPDPYCNAVLPVRAVWRGERPAFLHPLSLRYLAVRPIPPDAALGGVAAEADRPGDHEFLEPFEAPESLVIPPVLARLEAVARLVSAPLTAEAILAFIARADSPLAGIALDAVLPLLPLETLGRLADALLRDPDLLARFSAVLPEDVWARRGLPPLREWVSRRATGPAPVRRLAIGPDLDVLATAGQGHYVSLAHGCNAAARRKVPPRRNLCVIASLHNHGIYLLEWIAWHRAVGADEFFLYGNDHADDSDRLLAALADAGEIVWIDNRIGPDGFAREKAFSHALTLLPDVLDFRWAAVIDPDQFLAFDPARFDSAPAFLAWHERRAVDAIALDDIHAGSAGEPARGDAPVTRCCRDRLGAHAEPIVALFRPHPFIHHVDGPRADDRYPPIFRAANGDWLASAQPRAAGPPKPGAAAEFACILNYVFKSAEEYLWRRLSFSPLDPDPKTRDTVQQELQRPAIGELAFADRLDRCAPDLEAGIARLRALPGVADAEARVEQAYRARIRRIMDAWRPVLPSPHSAAERVA